MLRNFALAISIMVLAGGCARPQWPMEPPQKPDVTPELAKLERLVGDWSGTAEAILPSPEERKAMMPDGSDEILSVFQNGTSFAWTFDGMFLKGEGWHDMPEGQKVHYIEYWTWDPGAEKFRTWYFSDWGEYGQGWVTFDEDGNCLQMKASGHRADGSTMRGQGTLTFADHDTFHWTWEERGTMGKIAFKGTSHRRHWQPTAW